MQNQSIKDQVYEAILKDILDGVYPINAIINEKTLVEKYSVSKTPVREALVQLCSESILNNIPRTGYQLSMITPAQISDMLEFRKIIELAALDKCFSHLTKENIAELKALNKEACNITYNQNTKIHWESNQSFHKKLCSYATNQNLYKSLTDSLNFCTRIANQYFTKLWNESKLSDGSNHIEIVKAIEAGDLQSAKDILSRDVESFKDEIL